MKKGSRAVQAFVTLVLAVVVLFLTLTAALPTTKSDRDTEGDTDISEPVPILYVNGIRIPCALRFDREEENAELPILATVKAMDYPVRELEENKYEVEVEGKSFLIDTANGTVTDREDPRQEDLILTPPGATFSYKEARDGDIYVDQGSMRTVLMFMGIHATVRISFDSEQAHISSHRT